MLFKNITAMKTKKIKISDRNNNKNRHNEQKKVNKKVKNIQNQHLQRKVTLFVNAIEKNLKKNKKIKRKNYTTEAIQQAIKAVKDGATLRKAGDSFGVPAATLFRKIKNPELIDKKSGPPTVLKKQEEEEIVKWIMYRAKTGSPVTRNELLDSVESYLTREKRKTIFKNNRPGKKWYDKFRKRHPDLSIRTAQNLPLVRAMVTEENLRNWFHEVEEYLEKNNLKDLHGSRVFNCDETNIQLCPKPDKVLTQKGARSVYKVVDAAEKENITTLFMYNAEGKRAPPLILYPYKDDLPKKIIDKCPKGLSMGISETGWMTAETFYEYITNVFYPWIIQEQIELPVLVYLDGHASHVTIPLVSFCRERKIEIITLFAHSTHILQPLDIALFHPLKLFWKKAEVLWRNENNNTRLKKEDFAQVLLNALDLFKEESNAVKNGFCAAGLVPFNPNAVEYNVLDKKNKTKKCTVECQTVKENQSPDKNNNTDEEQHLMSFEANLSPDLLEKFKSCESIQFWDGTIENKGLFEYWLMIKKKISVGTEEKVVLTSPKARESINELDIFPSISLQDSKEYGKCNCTEQVTEDLESMIKDTESLTTQNNENSLDQIITVVTEESIKEGVVKTLNDPFIVVLDGTDGNCLNEFELCNESELQVLQELNNTKLKNSVEKRFIQEVSTEHDTISNKENYKKEGITESIHSENFTKSFIMPNKYLPKKKRVQLETKNKQKLPTVGTSDEWWKLQIEKEKRLEVIENKKAKKKKLQEEKKQLALKKKELEEKMKALQKQIKEEA